VSHPSAFAFSGVHVISPHLLPRITEEGVFSIIQTYLRLVGEGESVAAFRADQYYWRDLGKPENVSAAEKDIQQGLV
jgi:NDP-sugar pyrophosphorylase family protein